MPVYAYKGVAASGRSTRGFVDAESARAARAKLRGDGIVPTEVSEGGPSSIQATGATSWSITLPTLRRISGMDLAIATRQLATLLRLDHKDVIDRKLKILDEVKGRDA